MSSVALHRNRLEEVLGALSIDDMAWALKYLTDKLSSCLKAKSVVAEIDAKALERVKTEKFLASVCGKWEDDKDADEMVRDIYASRVNRDCSELERIFN